MGQEDLTLENWVVEEGERMTKMLTCYRSFLTNHEKHIYIWLRKDDRTLLLLNITRVVRFILQKIISILFKQTKTATISYKIQP